MSASTRWDSDVPLIAILGEVRINTSDGPRTVPARLDRLVLVRLVLARGRFVPVGGLAEALWNGHPPARARNAVQVKISRLRALLGRHAGRLTYAHDAYRLSLESHHSDVGRLALLTRQAQQALKDGDPAVALALASEGNSLWTGDPLVDLAEDPVVADHQRQCIDLWRTLREIYAQACLADPVRRSEGVAELRGLLTEDPLRTESRMWLMRALELTGRRAEALAVYDAGRRIHIEQTGLEPPRQLQRLLHDLLAKERRATSQPVYSGARGRVPDGLIETAHWLADEGELTDSLRLAVRGAWWWWITGNRVRGRDLLEELLNRSAGGVAADGNAVLSATAWLGVFGSQTAAAAEDLSRARAALIDGMSRTWTAYDGLAAALIAERLFERGQHKDAAGLITHADRYFDRCDDRWGRALCGAVIARGSLLSGNIRSARTAARRQLGTFIELGDSAGQMIALDVLGYCAEVIGDFPGAQAAHRSALHIAEGLGSADWKGSQLTRLGNVQALAGDPAAISTLQQALDLSDATGSRSIRALARNGLGVARHLAGDLEGSAADHLAAWDWYTATRSRAGIAYTGARLAMVGADSVGDAYRRAVSSLDNARATGDPRAVAHSLEAVGLVAADPREAIRALGAASGIRRLKGAPLPDAQARPLSARAEAILSAYPNLSQVWSSAIRDSC